MLEVDIEALAEKLATVEDLETFLVGLFAHAPVGLAVIKPTGHSLVVNQKFLDIFGSEPPPEYSLLADEQTANQGLREMLLSSFRGETITTPVFWFDSRDVEHVQIDTGRRVAVAMTTFPVRDRHGEIQYVVATYRDYTDEALALERAEAERDRFRALFASMLDGIVLLDRAGSFVEANPAAGRILGRATDELPGHSYADFVADQAELAAHWQRFQDQGQLRGEAVIRCADGSRRNIEYEFISQFAPGLYLSILRDITEQKRLQAERETLAEQLRQAQKIEAIGTLAGSVAHDFNNLLTVINGYSELLLEQAENSPAFEALEQIYRAGQQAAALTGQLLAFGRKSILKPVPLDLNHTIRKLEKMLKRLLREDIEIALRLDPAPEQVLIDPSQFEQVVMNLVINARDALPTGGLVLIETADITLEEQYDQTHAEVQAGRYVMLTVSDNGTGMDEATRQRIFEPFYTTKGEGHGTGLGLSTVHGIVRQSGGHIFVYSEPAHGTSFKLYFPCLALDPSTPDAAPASASLPEGSETVLLVEDVQEVRNFARLVLESCGYRVLTAASGAEALARHAGTPYDLLISDVIMPGMSGPRLVETLQAHHPQQRILYMSGYTDDAVLRYGILTQGMPFLAKPFSPSQLARKVREVLDSEPHIAAGG